MDLPGTLQSQLKVSLIQAVQETQSKPIARHLRTWVTAGQAGDQGNQAPRAPWIRQTKTRSELSVSSKKRGGSRGPSSLCVSLYDVAKIWHSHFSTSHLYSFCRWNRMSGEVPGDKNMNGDLPSQGETRQNGDIAPTQVGEERINLGFVLGESDTDNKVTNVDEHHIDVEPHDVRHVWHCF